MTALVWLRNDLRLADNPAIAAASARFDALVPLFVWAPDEEAPWAPGAASRVWLHHSLDALATSFAKRGARLVLRRGPSARALIDVARESGARAVYWNRRYEPAIEARDAEVAAALAAEGIASEQFEASLIHEPSAIVREDGSPYRVFTAYWKRWSAVAAAARPTAAPDSLRAPARAPASLPLEKLELLPTIDWAGGIRARWTFGEAGAEAALARFVDGGAREYADRRDRPGDDAGVSMLSPYLHHGEIGPRQIRRTLINRLGPDCAAPYLRQLCWRDFGHCLLHHFPKTPAEPLDRRFARFPWRDDPEALACWRHGRTGYPLVDAGMRELWASGWMHNRARMNVASFLAKHLLIDWRHGARWFWDTLVDADLANNTLGWQWTAGCGADAAPWFRIFSPERQGERFDPEGVYVRRWVPELARLPSRWIHRPWKAPEATLAAAGLRLGADYPRPMVEHRVARERALAAFAATPAR